MKVESKIPVEFEGMILAVSLLSLMIVSLIKTQPAIKHSVVIGLIVLSSAIITDMLIKVIGIKNAFLKILVALIIGAAAYFGASFIVQLK